jgi:hypothetical protein
MYKFINKQKKLKLGQKTVFKTGAPSNEPHSSAESQNTKETKESVNKLTHEELNKLKNKIEQSHIKFANKESISYDQSIFKEGTVVEVNRNVENLRDGEKFKTQSRTKRGEQFILTGDYKVLEYSRNKQERVYWQIKDSEGKTNYILGESITPIKSTTTTKKPDTSPEHKPEKNTETKTETQNPLAEKAKKTQESYLETPRRKLDRLSVSLTNYKPTRLENANFQNPDTLKNILKNDQVSDLERSKIENSMNALGINYTEIANILKENSNTLPLSELIIKTPIHSESEMKELREEFKVTTQGRAIQKEISKLEKSKNPEDKIKLTQKQTEFKSTQEAYAKQHYKEHLDYYRKNPSTKSILAGYIKKTQQLSLSNNSTDQAEFMIRYQKLKHISELANTLQNIKPKQNNNLNRDSIENIKLNNTAKKLTDWAEFNADRLNLSKEQIQNLKNNLSEKAFGAEETNLQILAMVQLATNQTLDELQSGLTIERKNGKLTINPDTLGATQLDRLTIGLAYTKGLDQSFFDRMLDKDNLTEAINTLQNSKSFTTAKRMMYYLELKDTQPSQKAYTHLNQIFDKNYSGNLSKKNDRYYTKTLEDSLGGSTIAVESTNILRRFTSDLSVYQNILAEVEVNGLVSEEKLISKFNQLIQLGILGAKMDEKLPKSEKLHLERLAKNNLQISKEDFKNGLSSAQISLIRYGAVYEQIRDDFLKNSDRSPNKLLEKSKLTEGDPQAAYAALATALQYIENGNLAIGRDTDSIDLPNGFKLKGGGALGVYVLENPKVSLGGSLTIKKDLNKKNTFYISTGAGVGFGPDTLETGINTEIGLSSKSSETMTAEIAAGGGLTLAGINVYIRGGLKENRILKDQNERFAKGIEKSSERKLSKQEITYLKNLANQKELSEQDIASASKFFPSLEETIQSDPGLQKVSPQELANFKANYIQTILRQINNMSIEEAEGVNWNAALGVGALITPIGVIPYITLSGGVEWGGDTKIMKLYNPNKKLNEQQLRDQLRAALKEAPKGTKLQIVSESGYATNIQGREVVVKGANEVVTNLEIGNPVNKLNTLRENTGLNFSTLRAPYFLKASIDDYRKVREGINTAKSTKVNVYLDPALENHLKIDSQQGFGELQVKLLEGQIPDNIVILRETIVNPSTSGGTSTEVKISFTTRENLLTGSEIEQSANLNQYISYDKFGRPTTNTETNNLAYNKLQQNETVSYGKNFTQEEANKLAEYSDGLISRSTTKLESSTHKPTAKLDQLIDNLAKDTKLVEELAKLTIHNIENGQRVDHVAAAELIKTKLGVEYKNLSKEDYLYVYGNLLPETFRSINSLTPSQRVEAINKLATQYVETYVKSLAKTHRKANGEKFTEAEQGVIIKNLSQHSKVKESFKISLLAPEVLLEGAGGSQNKLDLNGYNLYTTAHRQNLQGLRNSQITKVFENQIVKGSLTEFNSNSIPNQSERDLVNQFLHSLSEEIPSLDTNSVQPEALKNPEIRKQFEDILNSKTALLMMSTTPFKTNHQKISLLGAMYGPENLLLIEQIYEKMDKSNQLPIGMIINNPKAFQVMKQLTSDIQEVHNSQGTVEFKTYKDSPIEIKVNEESGVVLIGKCANPTYLYKRTLETKLNIEETNPAAGKAKVTNIYNLKEARRENMNRIGASTKASYKPKAEIIPPEDKIPPKDDTPGETPPEEKITPSKNDDVAKGVTTDSEGNTNDAANDSPF